MYASSCTLLRPLGAMNGFWGGCGADTGWALAAEPTNCGRAPAPGPSGMGTGGTPARAVEATAPRALAMSAQMKSLRTSPPRSERPPEGARTDYSPCGLGLCGRLEPIGRRNPVDERTEAALVD